MLTYDFCTNIEYKFSIFFVAAKRSTSISGKHHPKGWNAYLWTGQVYIKQDKLQYFDDYLKHRLNKIKLSYSKICSAMMISMIFYKQKNYTSY